MTPGATPGNLGDNDWQEAAQQDFERLYEKEYAFDLAEYLEINYDCAGVCKERLFYFALPVTQRPTKECSGEVSEQIKKDGQLFSAILMIASLIFLFTWVCQYSLWFKFKEVK